MSKPAVRAVPVLALAVVAFHANTAWASTKYRVKWGDTLSGLAVDTGLPVSHLAAANGIGDPNLIRAGSILIVPSTGASAAAPAPAAGHSTHRVRPGETLDQIAIDHGVSRARLMAANDIRNANSIRAGKVLQIPAGGKGGNAATWMCPVRGKVTFHRGDFGYVRPDGARHEGIDLTAARGAPVAAPVSGVVFAYPNRLGGKAFQLYGDDGVRYYGAHLQKYGALGRVSAGTVIGYVGNSGNAANTQPHLHFEAHPGGGPAVNPYPKLAAAC
ncbi:MAG: M23 family metallopeptidase [Actinomycetota bacterium]|nr:M23 family metallopeptidase [Actinomycetota bacterium]